MKIGILHLTDLHIENEIFLDRVENLVQAVEFDIKQISNLYLVLSGDITNYGRKLEFDNAKLFIDELQNQLKVKRKLLSIDIITVPGNHDCCFDDVKKTRKSVINDCRKDIIEEEDYFSDAMAVQSNYWNFNREITKFKDKDQISFKYTFRPHLDFTLAFHCYNTSWLTEIQEKQGDLTVPENKFIENENGEYIVSVFHHPIDWLSANTKKNNKQRFEEHIIKTSNFALYGHEHDNGKSKAVIQEKNNVVFCGGKAFNIKEDTETGFSFYKIDLADKSINIKSYKYNGAIYSVDFKDDYNLTPKNKREFILSSDFEKKLTDLNIPLKHSKKENLMLSDVFVFPDLEPLVDDDIVQYPNSSELIEKVKNGKDANIFIEGADQSGKTSLLFVLYKRFYEMGFTPIYLMGKYCKETNVKNLIKKSLKEQYETEDVDKFFQQSKKIILVDNFHQSELNSKYKKNLIDSFSKNFEFAFITSDNSYSAKNVTEEATSLKHFIKFKLLPLGHEKRSELIEQWLLIGENKMTLQDEILLNDVKLRFDEIDALIGNKLMPSYPVFILTLLQGLDENLQNFSQTSYANIYLVLIKAGIIKEEIKDSALTSLLNILKELAFYLFDKKEINFNRDDFKKFIDIYSKKYFRHQSLTDDKILNVLTNSNILKVEDKYYSFSYKYIYYFLIAQKISSEIDNYEDLIYQLCDEIHLEINANILIFLSHHSKAQILIDSIVFTSQIPFENSTPISLDKNDEFVKFISEFTNDIKDEVIDERNPKEEIKKNLQKKDVAERKTSKNEDYYDDEELIMPPEAIEINQAQRTVKIIGQIVKNQSGDFEREKLIKLVETAYTTIFRSLGFFSEMLVKDKDLLIESIVESIKEKEKEKNSVRQLDYKQIERMVRKMVQFISWRVCVENLTSLMYAVGTKGQDELFEQVNLNIDSTASKLVTFAIKTFYDRIDLKELKRLFEDVKDNYLAQCILREYVKRYLYTNFVERTKRDQIIQIAGFNKQIILPNLKKKKTLPL